MLLRNISILVILTTWIIYPFRSRSSAQSNLLLFSSWLFHYHTTDCAISYFLTKTCLELPLTFAQMFVQFIIVYYMINFQVRDVFEDEVNTPASYPPSVWATLDVTKFLLFYRCLMMHLYFTWINVFLYHYLHVLYTIFTIWLCPGKVFVHNAVCVGAVLCLEFDR